MEPQTACLACGQPITQNQNGRWHHRPTPDDLDHAAVAPDEQRAYQITTWRVWEGPPADEQPAIRVTVELPAGAPAPTTAKHLALLIQAWPAARLVVEQ